MTKPASPVPYENFSPIAAYSARDAWTAFWADPAQSRCAEAAPEIWQALTQHWFVFARSLPPGTRVLDLGCGAGIVGRLLLSVRPDLRVTGVDSAHVPLAPLANLVLLSGVAMELLPFGANHFDAVVSQYGFEYSDTEASTRELSRVLAPRARLSFLVHAAGSAIVSANSARSAAIDAFLATRSLFIGDPAAFAVRIDELRAEYSSDALMAALARMLPLHSDKPPARRVAIWTAVEEALAPERCVADSLKASCVAAENLESWSAPLRSLGALQPITALHEPDGTPIAWRIEGIR
jgi:SAM-dependent methyltransferase